MSEEHVSCTPLKQPLKSATLEPELRAQLEEIERRLIPLLVTVQRALGKEPSVMTREERRRGWK